MKKIIIFFIIFLVNSARGNDVNLKLFSYSDISVTTPIIRIAQDQRGLMYFLFQEGIVEYDGAKWRTVSLPQDLLPTAMSTNKEGRIFIGAANNFGYLAPDAQGVLRFISLKPEKKMREDGWQINKILILKDQVLFLAEESLFLVQGTNVHLLPLPSQSEDGFVSGDNFFVIDSKDGLLKLENFNLSSVKNGNLFRSVATLSGNSALIATRNNGLLLFDSKEMTLNLLEKQDYAFFKSSVVSDIVKLKNQYVFSTFGQGIVYASEIGQIQKQIKEYLDDPMDDAYALYVDKSQTLWFALKGSVGFVNDSIGASKDDIEVAKDDAVPFAALIRDCLDIRSNATLFGGAFFKELGGIQTLEGLEERRTRIEYSQNSLSFHFASNMVNESDRIEYQTFLQGFDDKWTDWDRQNSRDFTNLYWDDYLFQVRAKDSSGNISKISKFYFFVAPPWYESKWFYIAQVLFLTILLIFAGIMKATGSPIGEKISSKTIGILVSVSFSYTLTKVGYYGIIATVSAGVVFIKLVLSAGMGLVIGPVQDRVRLGFDFVCNRLTDYIKKVKSKKADASSSLVK